MFRKLGKNVKKLDAFPKIEQAYTQKSGIGGVVTTFTSVLLLFLVISELRNYVVLKQEYEFLVEQKSANTMQINLDMTIAMECSKIKIDLEDDSGKSVHVRDEFQLMDVAPSLLI